MADSELRRDAASITRSTKSGTATGRTLVEEGAGLAFGLPGKVVAKLSLTLLEHAVTAGLDRRKQKCMERVEELFAPIACTEDGEPELSEDDLLKLIREDPAKALDSILNAAINDDESKNVNVYGRFYRGLLRKRTRSSAGKRSFKAVKALSWGAICILRDFVDKNAKDSARIAKEGGARSDLRRFANNLRTETPTEVQELVLHGLFNDQQGSKPPFRGEALVTGLYPAS